jgi:hypothetical protein
MLETKASEHLESCMKALKRRAERALADSLQGKLPL